MTVKEESWEKKIKQDTIRLRNNRQMFMVFNLQTSLQVWSPISCCIKTGSYSGNFLWRVSLSADCSLEALSICDWRQINLGMIVTSKSPSPSCSFKTLGMQTKVFFLSLKVSFFFFKKKKRRRKTSGWHHISLDSIVWPTVFSRLCPEQKVSAACTFQVCLHQQPSIKAASVCSFSDKNLLWKYRILEKWPRAALWDQAGSWQKGVVVGGQTHHSLSLISGLFPASTCVFSQVH